MAPIARTIAATDTTMAVMANLVTAFKVRVAAIIVPEKSRAAAVMWSAAPMTRSLASLHVFTGLS